MLIASIIEISFVAIVYLAATIYSLHADKRDYDVKTYAGKGIYAIGHVGTWIGLACLILSVTVSGNPDTDLTGLMSLMVMGLSSRCFRPQSSSLPNMSSRQSKATPST